MGRVPENLITQPKGFPEPNPTQPEPKNNCKTQPNLILGTWYITKELKLVFSVFMKFLLDCHDEQKTIKKEKNNNDSLLQV